MPTSSSASGPPRTCATPFSTVSTEELAEHHPNVTILGGRHLGIELSVVASTARQAVDVALDHALQAAQSHTLDATVVSVELLAAGQQRGLVRSKIPDLAGVAEVAEIIGVSPRRAGQVARSEGFPAPVAQLKSGPVFRVEQVRRFAGGWRRPGRPRSDPQ